MQYKKTLATAALATSALAAYVPSEPWSTLTPSATYKGGLTNYASTFGIAVEPVASAAASSKAKRDAISQIGDGQIQAATTTKTTKAAVSQIGDGQAQAATKTATAGASQDTDGQVQNKDSSNPVTNVSCKVDGTLEMSIKDGILTDGKGRVGSIVSNRQFQFDGPPPQAGALYAAGWSITPEGNLALGDQDVFYQCLSGDFYNLYDESIASQCHPVYLQAIDLVAC